MSIEVKRRCGHLEVVEIPASVTTAESVEAYTKFAGVCTCRNCETASGLYWLGTDCEQGQYGMELNLAFSLECFGRAAELGHDMAQARLGKRYLIGYGAPKIPELAKELFERSAAQGNGFGMFELGRLKWKGLAARLDQAGAVTLMREASVAGCPLADEWLASAEVLAWLGSK